MKCGICDVDIGSHRLHNAEQCRQNMVNVALEKAARIATDHGAPQVVIQLILTMRIFA